MASFQHTRDNVLSASERTESALKCINLLKDVDVEKMTQRDRSFFQNQQNYSNSVTYSPREPTLQWLRDMVDRYVL